MVKATVMTVKKKRWIPIVAPQEFGGEKIGESYLAEPQQGIGRTLSTSLLTLTGDPSKQSLHVNFRIVAADKDKLTTEVIGFNIITSAARKMMRRGKDKIEDSFVVVTNDKKPVRVKPILVTKNRTKGSVIQNVRHHMRAHILKLVSELSYVDFVNSLIAHKFQRQLQDLLRKVYPLSVCEIRWMSLEPEGVPIKETLPALPPAEEEQKTAEVATP